MKAHLAITKLITHRRMLVLKRKGFLLIIVAISLVREEQLWFHLQVEGSQQDNKIYLDLIKTLHCKYSLHTAKITNRNMHLSQF